MSAQFGPDSARDHRDAVASFVKLTDLATRTVMANDELVRSLNEITGVQGLDEVTTRLGSSGAALAELICAHAHALGEALSGSALVSPKEIVQRASDKLTGQMDVLARILAEASVLATSDVQDDFPPLTVEAYQTVIKRLGNRLL